MIAVNPSVQLTSLSKRYMLHWTLAFTVGRMNWQHILHGLSCLQPLRIDEYSCRRQLNVGQLLTITLSRYFAARFQYRIATNPRDGVCWLSHICGSNSNIIQLPSPVTQFQTAHSIPHAANALSLLSSTVQPFPFAKSVPPTLPVRPLHKAIPPVSP